MEDLGSIPLEDLKLDPLNPRLPDEIQGKPESELLEYLFEHDALDELAASFVANNYFANEPVLVLPRDADGRRIVVEGNRRVSTLKILTKTRLADSLGLAFDLDSEPSEEQLKLLQSVPAHEVADRQELSAYLGYRHIGGVRPWSSEAKARWIHTQVLARVAAGDLDPFYEVGRIIGSNARGVRSKYVQLEVLRRARREAGVRTAFVENERFSVWGLVLGNPNLLSYIHFGKVPSDYAGVTDAIALVDYARVGRIVADLTPGKGGPAVLRDSRDVGLYGEVLADVEADELLQHTLDLQLAYGYLQRGGLSQRLQQLVLDVKQLFSDVVDLEVSADDLALVGELELQVRTLRGAIGGNLHAGD